MLAQRLAAFAIERKAGRIHEHDGEIGKEIAALVEQLLFDHVFYATRREGVLALLLHLLAQPAERVNDFETAGFGI